MLIPKLTARRGRPSTDVAAGGDDASCSGYGVVACDRAGDLVLVNRAARELLGAELSRATGPDGPLARVLRGQDAAFARVEVAGPERTVVVETSAEAVVDADGALTGAVMVLSDVTSRAQQARREFESAVTAHLAEAVVVVRARDGNILYANDTCERLFGHRPAELVGRHASVLSAGTEATPGRRVREIAAAVATGRIWTGDVDCRRTDGTHVWTSLRVSGLEHPVHDSVWICVHGEAAPRRAAEEAARVAETRFRAVFEAAEAPMLLIAGDLRVVDANAAAAHLTGFGAAELRGRYLADLTHPDDIAAGARIAAQLFAGDQHDCRVEQRIVTRDGQCIRVALTATAVFDAGRAAYAMATLERLSAPIAREARWATTTPC